MKASVVFATLLGSAMAFPIAASGAELKLDDKPYNYTIIDQDLRDVLRQFANNMHLRFELSDAVKGRVRGGMPTASPRQFLETLAMDYGLDWYFDGFKLYVTANTEDVSKLVAVPRDVSGAFREALSSGGISDPRFPLREMPGTDSVVVSGPPHFVDLVEQTVSALVAPKPAAAAAAGSPDYVIVYRGAGAQRTEFPKAAPGTK